MIDFCQYKIEQTFTAIVEQIVASKRLFNTNTINISESLFTLNPMVRMGKFSKKYGLFLSDASNEEIVSVSKELMNEMSSEVKTVNGTALSLLAASLVSLILMISLVSSLDTSLIGTAKSVVFLTRITAIALLCMSAVVSGIIIMRMSDASSISSILWRNVRETADDERAYEQTQAVKVIGDMLNSSKNQMKLSAISIAAAGIILGFGFIYELLIVAGYM